MNKSTLLIAMLFVSLTGCQSDAAGRALSWWTSEAGPSCDARGSDASPFENGPALELVTRSLPDDKAGMKAVVKVRVQRRDGEPLCALGELAGDGGRLVVDMLRDERSGDGLPAFSMPYISLIVRSEHGEVELIWETAYNGYRPRGGVFPEGVWLRDIAVGEGTFWMRSFRNFNVKDGFQPLSAWVAGHVTTWQKESTTLLDASAPVIGIEIGFGNGVPGLMHAWIDNLQLHTANRPPYELTFDSALRGGPKR